MNDLYGLITDYKIENKISSYDFLKSASIIFNLLS